MHTTALVGRAAELAVLRARVDAAARGEGGAVLLTGEAGIGKSRLAAEAAARAAATGATVLTGRAVEGGGTFRPVAEALAAPLRTLRDPAPPLRAALARLVPGWADGNAEWEPEVDPAVLLGEGVLALLARGSVLVLEDLHWADVDTLRLTGYLARAAPAAAVLVLLTARDDARPAPELARLAADPAVRTLPLARLDEAAVAALSAARRGSPLPAPALRDLVARADGLPLLVEELVDPGGPDVPPSFAALVAGRLAALDPAHRAVVTAAALPGGDPDVPVLARVTSTSPAEVVAALRAATDAGLLRPEPDGLRWRHALTRDAVLTDLLAPERALLAARTAEALEARGTAEDRALAADLHVVAGQPDRAADAFLALARRDAARGALRSADALLVRAAATGRRPGAVAVERVGVLTRLGRVAEARAAGTAALRDAVVTGDQHAELCLGLARAAVAAGEWADVERWVARAGRPDDPRSFVLRADAAFGTGAAARSAALAADAVRAADAALAAHPGPAAAATLCEALNVAGRRTMDTDLDRAVTHFRRAVQTAGEHGIAPWEVEALFCLGMAELMAGSPTVPSLAAAHERGLATGVLQPAVQARLLASEAALHVEGPAAGLVLARDAAREAGRLGLVRLQAMAELMSAGHAALLGEGREAAALLAAARGHDAVPREVETLPPLVDGLTALLAHDLPRAARSVDAGVVALMPHGSAAPTGFFGLWALLRTVAADREAEARAALRGHYAVRTLVNRAALTYADAVAAGRDGRPADAVRGFAEADAALARLPWWNRLLRSLALEAAVVDGWGDPVPALRADLAAHEETGATALARTCRDLLRRAGAPTRRGRGAARVPPELRARGVTSREADVLALVAEGLSNAEVAGRLFLSPRTVETHVANLLAKTGAADRNQLRAWISG